MAENGMITDRDSLYESLKQSLNEVLEYQDAQLRGEPTKLREVTIAISPVHVFSKEEIKEIRKEQNMTQKFFAEVLGVSVKTVEAWEAGTSSPSGVANRMLELITKDGELFKRCSVISRQSGDLALTGQQR